jgi:hypothetical protein
VFASADYFDGINLYEIKGDLISVEKKGGGFKTGEIFRGVAFHPKVKDYLIGFSEEGRTVLLKVNLSDWSLKKEAEFHLIIGDEGRNVAFNGNGKIATLVGYNR